MDSQQVLDIISSTINNEKAIRELLLRCSKKITQDKFSVKIILRELRNLLDWLGGRINNIDNYLSQIRRIPIERIGSEELNDIIEDMFSDIVHLRMEHTVHVTLDWMEKNNINTQNILYDVDQYFESIDNQQDTDDMYDKLNDIFTKYTGKNYEYYYDKYTNFIDDKILRLVNEWSSSKFKIIDRYGVNNNILDAAKSISKKYKKKKKNIYKRTTVADQNLQNINNIVQGGEDVQLKKDKTRIEDIAGNYVSEDVLWTIKDAWDEVFKYLRNEKLKPNSSRRNQLYILLVHIVANIPLETINNSSTSLKYADSLYNKMFYSGGVLPSYKDSFSRYISPRIDLGILLNYLKENKNTPPELIEKIRKTVTKRISKEQNPTIRKQREIIYKVLKKHKQKIERKILKTLLITNVNIQEDNNDEKEEDTSDDDDSEEEEESEPDSEDDTSDDDSEDEPILQDDDSSDNDDSDDDDSDDDDSDDDSNDNNNNNKGFY